MKICFRLLALLSFFSLLPYESRADFNLIKIRNLNADYQAPSGTATADEFLVPLPTGPEQIEMRFFKRDQSYIFVYADKEFVLKNPPSMLNDVENFTLSDINLVSEKSEFKVDLGRADIYAKESETHMRKLNGFCPEKFSSLGQDEKVIDSCTTNANVNLEFASFKDFSQNTKKEITVNKLLTSLLPQNLIDSTNSMNVEVSVAQIAVKNNAFQLSMTIAMEIRAQVRGSGMIWYLSKEKQIKIRLDVLKASILDVREQVFKEIEKSHNPKIVVQRPYIILNQK